MAAQDPLRDVTDMAKKAAEEATHTMRNDPRQDVRFMKALSVTLAPKILNGIKDNIIVINQMGKIILTNQNWNLFSEENGGDVDRTGLGANYLEVCRKAEGPGAEDANTFGELLEGLLEGNENEIEMEYECSGPEGERWFIASGTRVNDNAFVISHRDITNRKLDEIQIEKQNKALAELVQSKSVLVAAVSHDIKNTLASTKGILAMLKDLANTEEKREMIDIGLSKLNLTDDFLQNLLLFFKNNSEGSITTPPAAIDLADLLTQVMKSHDFDAKSKGLTLSHATPIENWNYHIVQIDLTMALSNLIGNAIKYTDSGGSIEVNLSSTQAEANQRVVRIDVKDTGRGIPEEALDKLTQPYVQVYQKDHETGFGLGLNNVKTIANKYQGRLEINSKINEGSLFSLFLVLEVSEKTEASACERDQALRILLIEDEPVSRKITQLAFKGKGHQIIGFPGIQETIEHYRPEDFDVILCDFNLGSDGNAFDLVEAIRPTQPVVCYSGEENLPENFQEKGIHSHVVKPASLQTLQTALFRALDESTQG